MRVFPKESSEILEIVQDSGVFPELRSHAFERRVPPLWLAHDLTLLDLRLVIHHQYLRKKPPTAKLRYQAIQRALALLTAFARVHDTRQIVVSTDQGHPYSISFQPRPFGMNWTAQHALSFTHDTAVTDKPNYTLRYADFAHLTYKVVCAICGAQAGSAPDGTATFVFDPASSAMATVVVRALNGAVHRAVLEAEMA